MSATNDRRKQAKRGASNPGDETANQALERAIDHASLALAEGVASARAALDASSLVVSGLPADSQPNLAELARTLDQIAGALSGESPSLRATAINTLLEAIDSEVSRWEVRSRSDQDARAVLRVYMGLREVLWEVGIRREAPDEQRRSASQQRAGGSNKTTQTNWKSAELKRAMSNLAGAQSTGSKSARKPRRRIQRINIDG